MPRRTSPMSIIAILALVCIFVVPTMASDSPLGPGVLAGATVRISPASASVEVGDSVTVDVYIQDIVDLYGAEVQLSFDPALLEAQEIINGSVPVPGFVIKNVDNSAGTVSYAITQMNPAEPYTGSGTVFRIRFLGKSPGTSAVAFTFQKFLTRDIEVIPVTPQPGEVTVAVGGPPTATPMTPTATATSTPMTPTATATSTPMTPTATATSTPVTPTATATATPVTPTATATPVTPSPTPDDYWFSGYVQDGGTALGIAGVTVKLYRWIGAGWSEIRTSITSDSGLFGLWAAGGGGKFAVVEINPEGYISTGAWVPGGLNGVVVNDDRIEFDDPPLGFVGPCRFYDVSESPTETPTATPVTPTATPGTPTPTWTPTATPTPELRVFEGNVYVGALGDRSVPLPGALVELYGSDDSVALGTWLGRDTSDADGFFQIEDESAYLYYSLKEWDPDQYVSTGAEAGAGGQVVDLNRIQYARPGSGTHGGSAFFDLLSPGFPETPIPTPTPGGYEIHLPLVIR